MTLQLGRDGMAFARGSVETVATRLRSARRLLPSLARDDAALPADLRLALSAVPMVESLEGRQMCYAVTPSGSTITLDGYADQANKFEVGIVDGKLRVASNYNIKWFDWTASTRVVINGGERADRVLTTTVYQPAPVTV
jgi:hypothetical protein